MRGYEPSPPDARCVAAIIRRVDAAVPASAGTPPITRGAGRPQPGQSTGSWRCDMGRKVEKSPQSPHA
jgi:hypothetical protein